MLVQPFRKASVIEDQEHGRPSRLHLEPGNRVHTLGPRYDSPSLNYPLIRNQFDVPTDNVATEKREGTADFPIDLSWPAGERCESLRIQQRLVERLRACRELDFLMN